MQKIFVRRSTDNHEDVVIMMMMTMRVFALNRKISSKFLPPEVRDVEYDRLLNQKK